MGGVQPHGVMPSAVGGGSRDFFACVPPSDDGKIFHGSGVGDPFGPRCYKGDIMGCGIMFPRDYILDSEGMGGTRGTQHPGGVAEAPRRVPPR